MFLEFPTMHRIIRHDDARAPFFFLARKRKWIEFGVCSQALSDCSELEESLFLEILMGNPWLTPCRRLWLIPAMIEYVSVCPLKFDSDSQAFRTVELVSSWHIEYPMLKYLIIAHLVAVRLNLTASGDEYTPLKKSNPVFDQLFLRVSHPLLDFDHPLIFRISEVPLMT